MNSIYQKFSFIVAFMIFVVFFNMAFGGKATEYLLILVLLGMLLTNINQVKSLFTSSMQDTSKGIMETPQYGGDPKVLT